MAKCFSCFQLNSLTLKTKSLPGAQTLNYYLKYLIGVRYRLHLNRMVLKDGDLHSTNPSIFPLLHMTLLTKMEKLHHMQMKD